MPSKWWLKAKPFPGILLVTLGGAAVNLAGPNSVSWAIILLGVVYLLVSGTERPRRTPLDWAILLLLLTAVLSIPISTALHLTLNLALGLLASVIMFYALVFWAQSSYQYHITAWALIFMGVCLAIAAPFIVNWHLNKTGLVPDVVYTHLPPLILSDSVHPNIMATLLLLLMPLALAFCLVYWPGHLKRTAVPFFIAAFASLLIGMTLLLTRSRGGYLAAAMSVILLLWWMRWRKTAVLLTLIASIVAIWLATAVTPAPSQEITDTSTMAFRLYVWRTALIVVADFPFTGVGMGTFNDVASRLYPFPPTTNPGAHNLFLQVAIDLGLFGLIAYISLVLLTLTMGSRALQIYRQRQDNSMIAISGGSLAGFIGMLLHGLVDNTVWGTRMSFVPWLIVGLITAVFLSAWQKNSAKPGD
ncbi:MAG TPA: O-antigen ligase family protein [Chloroflexota bacterium]|nr:O-antigen ligase family protein [Chloroflexota bacterium]HUM67643.1 O-antigen ligase family protein [Chloroflexota bacterium]